MVGEGFPDSAQDSGFSLFVSLCNQIIYRAFAIYLEAAVKILL